MKPITSANLTMTSGGRLVGRTNVPGDKSISHRALLLGAIAEGRSHVENFLPAGDTLSTLRDLRTLGVDVADLSHTSLVVHGRGLHGLQEPGDVLDCGRSGTSIRLLAGLLAGQSFVSILTGDPQLRRRPMGRIVEPLRRMGATVLGRDGGRLPPIVILGGALHGIDYMLPVASAQVKSSLLLAGLYGDGRTTLHVPGSVRDHTERMLVAMGCGLEIGDGQLTLEPGNPLRAVDVVIPGDFSSAAFLIAGAVLAPGSEVHIQGVGVNPTRTGLLDILQVMGADVSRHNERIAGAEPVADLTVRTSGLRGAEVGGSLVVRSIDELPVLAVAATQAEGTTVVRDAAELRLKETDRIAVTAEELRKLGAEIEPLPDGLVVHGPTRLKGSPVHSHGDHRLAMALAIAGLIASGETLVEDVGCIADSFPGFEATLVHLGAHLP